MKTRLLAALLLGCFTAHCAHRYQAQSVTPEAAALLTRADAPGANSLILDFEMMRQLDLIETGHEDDHAFVDLLQTVLTVGSGELQDDPAGPAIARAAVLVGLLREWNVWPQVKRFGLVVPSPRKGMSFEALADEAVVVLAVKGDQAANAELLQGIAAADRGSGKPMLSPQGDKVCFTDEKLPTALCARAGPGFLALSTPRGLENLAAARGAEALPTVSGPLLRLRTDLPDTGKGDLTLQTVRGTEALRLSAVVQAAHPRMAELLEKNLKEALQKLDESHANSRSALEPVLTSTRQTLAADPGAPAGLKKASEALTLDRLLDPDGNYAATRQSIQISRTGSNLTAEVVFPEKQVQAVIKNGKSLMIPVAVAGVLASLAIPNFIKFQCRSKQSEAKANLKGAYVAQKSYFMERDRYGKTFEAISFLPESGTRYTYCMNGQCLACTRPGCQKVADEDNPCLLMLSNAKSMGKQLAICAIGDVDDNHAPDDLDIWFIDEKGELENRYNDCQ